MLITHEEHLGHRCVVITPTHPTEFKSVKQFFPPDAFFLSFTTGENFGKIATIFNPAFSVMLKDFAQDRFSKEITEICAVEGASTLFEWIESVEKETKAVQDAMTVNTGNWTLPSSKASSFFARVMTLAAMALEDIARSGMRNYPDISIPVNIPVAPVKFCLADLQPTDLAFFESTHKYHANPAQCRPSIDNHVRDLLPFIDQVTQQPNNLEMLQESFAYFFLYAYPDILKTDPLYKVNYAEVVFSLTRTKWAV